jgi:hypothetical protein
MNMDWTKKGVLVTGGTSSFGKKFIKMVLDEYHYTQWLTVDQIQGIVAPIEAVYSQGTLE